MTGKIEKDFWHPGFVGAIELEFINDKEFLFFDRENELSKEWLKIEKETHSSFRLMTEHLQEDDVIRFLETVIGYREPGDRSNIDAVLSISSSANADNYCHRKQQM